MTEKPPTTIKHISAFILILSALLILFGAFTLIVSQLVVETGNYAGFVYGNMMKLYGILLLVSGFASAIIGIGLYKMQNWARIYGVGFFKSFFLLSILMFIFNIMSPICSISSMIIAILSGYCWIKLRNPSIRIIFESGVYEAPDWMNYSQEHRKALIEPYKAPTEVSIEPKVNVPDTMTLCSNCNTMNLKTDDYCRICGTEINI